MAERVISGRRKDVSESKNGQIIGLRQGQKSYKKIAEITSMYLCTIQRNIKTWKDVNEPSSSRKRCCRRRILNNRNSRSLKRLAKIEKV
ncbi:hypothetical protein AVEN_171180-1 [Araneus ventricosus]|nr:hypothetical protein AVEN_233435-1 [Araneus ventricosus]GBO33512.1 hypothetical protein AVEN_171180-1 [Araneus ventricosus]